MLTLSKRLPARTKTETATWCKKDFMEMSQTFRDVRTNSRNPMDKCFWCAHPFADGEMMALACFGSKGNKTLCRGCADELMASETKKIPSSKKIVP
jgi:hypothetical protein